MTENIKITNADVQNSITFLEQYLSDKMPGVDFGPGTSSRDIAINSVALTVAYLRAEISNVRNRQSLKTIALLPDTEPVDDVVDGILSNWHITRKAGKVSSGVITLRFSQRDIGTVFIKTADVFTRGDVTFSVLEDVFLTGLSLRRNRDTRGEEYYTASVSVTCNESGPNDILPGPFDSWTINSVYLYSVDNASKFTGGSGIESTEALIARSKDAPTVRDLNASRAISTVLMDTFSQVEDVIVAGYGDPDFQRDRVDLSFGLSGTLRLHRGSMMDIWVKFPVHYNKTVLVTPTTAVIDGAQRTYFYLPSEPVLRVVSLKDESDQVPVDVPYTIRPLDVTTVLSERQQVICTVASQWAGYQLTLIYDSVEGYDEVQDFVENSSRRVVVADPLVKALHSMYLKFNLRYEATAVELDTDAAAKDLQDFVYSWDIREEMSVSALVKRFMSTNADTVHRLELPVTVVGTTLMSSGEVLEIVYTDRLQIPSSYARTLSGAIVPVYSGDVAPAGSTVVTSADVQLSTRTTRYLLPAEDITITEI